MIETNLKDLQRTALLYGLADVLANEADSNLSSFKSIIGGSVSDDENIASYIREADTIARAFQPQECSDKFVSIFDSLNHKGNETMTESKKFYPKYDEVSEIFNLCIDKNSSEIEPVKLLELLKEYFVFMPAKGYKTPDISYFDHAKITTAIATCLYQYDKNRGEASNGNFENQRKDKKFLVVAGEFSGIQEFIYTITSKSAMKSLRGRSFFLELFTEHLIDEILVSLGLNRINLLYSGASMFYLLLPNESVVVDSLEKFKKEINDHLLENFGTKLYFELSYTEVSSNQLGNKSDDTQATKENHIGNIFRNISKMASINKISRYDEKQLEELFCEDSDLNRVKSYTSECKICKKPEDDAILSKIANKRGFECCKTCDALIELGSDIARSYLLNEQTNDKKLIAIYKNGENSQKSYIEMPTIDGEKVEVRFVSEKELVNSNPYRFYNTTLSLREILEIDKSLNNSNKFVMMKLANYNVSCKEEAGEDKYEFGLIEFEKLVKKAEGIERLGIFRADVDSLGTIFQSGFAPEELTIAKSAVMSRKLSEFFKSKINTMLEMEPIYLNAPEQYLGEISDEYIFGKEKYSLEDESETKLSGKDLNNSYGNIISKSEKRDIVLLYSGGDDLFAIGTWNHIIEFAMDLRNAFKKFSKGKVTLSGGIGIFSSGYPVYDMAYRTEKLESMAKSYITEKNGIKLPKNAISIFVKVEYHRSQSIREKNKELKYQDSGQDTIVESIHTYSWDEFIDGVMGEKYKFLKDIITLNEDDNTEKIFIGKTRLYYMMDLILKRLYDNDNKVDIARFAYSLARINISKKQEEAYNKLRLQLFDWIKCEKNARQLYTAINILIYEVRE